MIPGRFAALAFAAYTVAALIALLSRMPVRPAGEARSSPQVAH